MSEGTLEAYVAFLESYPDRKHARQAINEASDHVKKVEIVDNGEIRYFGTLFSYKPGGYGELPIIEPVDTSAAATIRIYRNFDHLPEDLIGRIQRDDVRENVAYLTTERSHIPIDGLTAEGTDDELFRRYSR